MYFIVKFIVIIDELSCTIPFGIPLVPLVYNMKNISFPFNLTHGMFIFLFFIFSISSLYIIVLFLLISFSLIYKESYL